MLTLQPAARPAPCSCPPAAAFVAATSVSRQPVGRTTSRGRRCACVLGGSALRSVSCCLLLAACLAAWPVISLRLHSCLHQLFICTTPHSWPLPPGLPAYHCSGDYIRSDYEEKQAIATLQAIELVKYCMEVGACPLDFHGLSWPSAGWAFGRLCGWVLQAAWRGGGPG